MRTTKKAKKELFEQLRRDGTRGVQETQPFLALADRNQPSSRSSVFTAGASSTNGDCFVLTILVDCQKHAASKHAKAQWKTHKGSGIRPVNGRRPATLHQETGSVCCVLLDRVVAPAPQSRM